MGRSCQIYRQSKVDSNLISDLPARIEQCFTNIGLKVSPEIHILDPPPKAYSKSRGQYKAGEVVDHCCRKAPGKICLNFVFGVAHRRHGCMVTLYRLNNDPDFVYKECVHELGHVFGLGHCRLPCVMTFSNSVAEAHMKNITFCPSCLSKLL